MTLHRVYVSLWIYSLLEHRTFQDLSAQLFNRPASLRTCFDLYLFVRSPIYNVLEETVVNEEHASFFHRNLQLTIAILLTCDHKLVCSYQYKRKTPMSFISHRSLPTLQNVHNLKFKISAYNSSIYNLIRSSLVIYFFYLFFKYILLTHTCTTQMITVTE